VQSFVFQTGSKEAGNKAIPAFIARYARVRFDDLVFVPDRFVNWNRERQPLNPTRARVGHRIDADHFAFQIEELSARVVGIDGDVGLNERCVAVVDGVRDLTPTMPNVTVLSRPYGEPIAATHSPILLCSGSPIFTVRRLLVSI
jgi:hypothetical protein